MRIEAAADRVTFATIPSVAVLAVENSFSVKVFPPNTNARTTTTKIRVRGRAIIGELNHNKTSSIAATPKRANAQVGMDAEYVYF